MTLKEFLEREYKNVEQEMAAKLLRAGLKSGFFAKHAGNHDFLEINFYNDNERTNKTYFNWSLRENYDEIYTQLFRFVIKDRLVTFYLKYGEDELHGFDRVDFDEAMRIVEEDVSDKSITFF